MSDRYESPLLDWAHNNIELKLHGDNSDHTLLSMIKASDNMEIVEEHSDRIVVALKPITPERKTLSGPVAEITVKPIPNDQKSSIFRRIMGAAGVKRYSFDNSYPIQRYEDVVNMSGIVLK